MACFFGLHTQSIQMELFVGFFLFAAFACSAPKEKKKKKNKNLIVRNLFEKKNLLFFMFWYKSARSWEVKCEETNDGSFYCLVLIITSFPLVLVKLYVLLILYFWWGKLLKPRRPLSLCCGRLRKIIIIMVQCSESIQEHTGLWFVFLHSLPRDWHLIWTSSGIGHSE